ncbi:MAG: trigger factor [Candidatus Melainabacteria bacterium RIFCSPLOWO2_02_FULL_35_15]|nr:MAG: trigger factor [Candidatus Melainabacteria bacterium RIFCSPLOWO2_12_FULL_35_11]OGI12780.1 MAG: trigger factor [Candidatus Melainabacteria bacterium RIFCSPLOWO2_02_FULL_35_15]
MKQVQLKVLKSSGESSKEVELSVEAPVDISNKAYSIALRDISNNIDIPGFRKGKAPKEIVEKKFGIEFIGQRAFESIFSDVLLNAAEQEKLDIIEVLKVSSYELVPDKPLTFKVIVELKPEVKIGKYKNLKISAKKTIYDKEIFTKKTLDRLASNFITFKTVSDRALKQGDLVTLNFEGKFDDGSDIPGGKAENFQVLLEKDKFLPEFVDKLQGTKIGEEKEILITFPDNYVKDFSGKKARFKVKVNSIEEKVFPEIDDELAKKLGLENMDRLRNQIEMQMKFIQESNNQKELENNLLDEIIKNSEYEISPRMIEKEVDYLLADLKKNCEKDGIKWEDFKNDPKNKDLLVKAREAASKRISIDLILTAIIKSENMTVTSNEVNAEVKNRINQLGEKYNHLQNDRKFVSMVEFILLRNQAVDFLVKNSDVSWKDEVTRDIPD